MKRLNDHAYLASTLTPPPYKKDEAERAAFATIALWMFAAGLLLVAMLALGGCSKPCGCSVPTPTPLRISYVSNQPCSDMSDSVRDRIDEFVQWCLLTVAIVLIVFVVAILLGALIN